MFAWPWWAFVDSERLGVSYSRDVLPVLQRWGISIRGHDIGATVNEAMRKDIRLERVPVRRGIYRRLPN